MFGNGIGTASLGVQYVSKIAEDRRTPEGVDSGWGNLILELGIPGLALWIVWTTAAAIACWKVASHLRTTVYAPFAFAIAWFVFFLLIPTSYYTTDMYENYIWNAYLWLLIGILFRLPGLTFPAELGATSRTKIA